MIAEAFGLGIAGLGAVAYGFRALVWGREMPGRVDRAVGGGAAAGLRVRALVRPRVRLAGNGHAVRA